MGLGLRGPSNKNHVPEVGVGFGVQSLGLKASIHVEGDVHHVDCILSTGWGQGECLGFRDWSRDLGFRDRHLRFRVLGLGFRDLGLVNLTQQ